MTVGGIAVAWRPTAERGSTSKPHPDHEVEASEEIRMERKNGNITTLMLGASTCSENRLSRLISHLRQATVIGFSAMTLLILASTAQAGLITNGSFTSVGTDPFTGVAYTSSYTLFTGNLPSWTYDSANGSLDCLVFPGTALTNPCGQNPNSAGVFTDRKSTRLNSSHLGISY